MMLLDCILAPALVLPDPGWQVAEQAHAASAQEQCLLRLAQVHALLGEVAERGRAVITLRYGLGTLQGNVAVIATGKSGGRLLCAQG